MASMDTQPRCQYQSANCESAPAVKDNGTLHRLCAFHRDKANETQRRWHDKHKKTPHPQIAKAGRLTSFERRAIARLLAATRTTDATITPTTEEVAKICREQEQRRCLQRLAAHQEIDGSDISTKECKTDATFNLSVGDLAGELNDDEIQELMEHVLEYNEASFGADDEFIHLVDAWFEYQTTTLSTTTNN